VSGVARRGVHGRARLESAHGDDLLSLPYLEGEGAGSLAEDGVETIVEGLERGTIPLNDPDMPDQDETGNEEISRELAGQLAGSNCVQKIARKSRSIQRFQKMF
jgi:hypothetical protein